MKNTILSKMLDLFAPNFCMCCGKIGNVLCDDCFDKRFPVITKQECDNRLWCTGERLGLLKRMINEYKYNCKRDLAIVFAKAMDNVLPRNLIDVSIVPLPTIDRHIRVRGFDHCLLLARKLAELRGYEVERLLTRKNDYVQVGASKNDREKQARSAYEINGMVNTNRNYLLLDDVYTSGSSMKNAERILRENGAQNIYKIVLAKEV